ncbi:MAG: VOC family protein [Thermoleophilaceae bacterium]|nr:VOC family protein [Thermoleophilaceae bacterium]
MIEHVSFTVSRADAQACAGFYKLLGFSRIEPPAGLGDRSIWLRRNGTSLHLMFRDRDGVDIAQSPQPGAGHIALVVDQYDAVIGALTAAGANVDPRSEYWGSPRAYVQDPAGNLVELMAFAPT